MPLPSFLYDLTIPPLEYHRRSREWYREMRANQPVVYDDDHNIWLVMRYEDALRVSNDHITFSSASFIRELEFSIIAGMDPPDHTRMRTLVTQALSKRTFEKLVPDLEDIVTNLLKKALPKSEIDWVADLAHPLPLQVIAHMLGLPLDGWPQYRDWADACVNQRPNQMEAAMQFMQVFIRAIEDHQQHPQDDVMSLLIAAEIDGDRLKLPELIGFCFTLFVAGYITTSSLLGNTVLCFDQYPEALSLVRQNPKLIPRAVEEVLRFMDPFRGFPADTRLSEGRYVTTDTELGGQLLRRGDRVKVDQSSVNFDEEIFTDPERFDIMRTPNRHQAFGHGIHYCLGAPLARLEAKIACEKMLEMLQDVQVVPDQQLEQIDSYLTFALKHLLLTFRPA
jgi:cytochrome P450